MNRLPGGAKAVFEVIRDVLRKVVCETPFQKRQRLEDKIQKLEMGKRTLAAFRALLEESAFDLQDAGVAHYKDKDHPYYLFISKLNPVL